MSDSRYYPANLRLNGSGGYTAKNTNQQSKVEEQQEGVKFAEGPPSLMTPNFIDGDGVNSGYSYSITTLSGRGDADNGYGVNNRLLRDDESEKPWYDIHEKAKEPTTTDIINWSKEQDKLHSQPFKFTDFVFCKYWNKIPNNYMMTLRRFAYPVWDNLKFPGSDKESGGDAIYFPIAQAIGYVGEETGNTLSSLLNFDVGLNFKEIESEIHTQDQSQAADGPRGTSGLAKVLGLITGETTTDEMIRDGEVPPDPYSSSGPYANHVQGPVNVIKKIQARDQGLKFEQSFNVKFSYIARPIDGINTKAVMLDIMANLLLLSYADAAFWGGMHRFRANKTSHSFLGGEKGMKAWYDGDPAGFLDATTKQITEAGSVIGGFLSKILEGGGSAIETLKGVTQKVAEGKMAMMVSGKKAQIAALPALLTGSPTGEWHLQVGSPFNPMLNMGNLICKGAKFEFGEMLGADDFPMELNVTFELEHAMPRDKASIESMFNKGSGKIYTLPNELESLMKSSPVGTNAKESKIDNTNIGRKTQVRGDKENILDNVNKNATNAISAYGKVGTKSRNIVKTALGYGK